ncbi:30S ribosomal protein S7 [bacterium]|nr:30S ribosomal protein S7 [bacterium]
MRGKKAVKRNIESDPIYKSKLVTKFINYLMLDGKKSKAKSAVYTALESLHEDPKEALVIFEDVMKKVMPKQEVRSKRVGGATYQVPVLLKHERSQALAIRWILEAIRKRKGASTAEKLTSEFSNIVKGENSVALKKREDVEKMAESNKAFSHFRW